MKTIIIALIYLTLSLHANSQVNETGPNQKMVSILLDDSTRLEYEFFSDNNLRFARTYFVSDSVKILNGYQFEFYENRRLKSVTYFNRGINSAFLLQYSKNGNTEKVYTMDDRSIMDLFKYEIENNINNCCFSPITNAHGHDDSTFLQIHKSLKTQDIYAFVEVSTDDPDYKRGLYLIKNKKQVSLIKNYYRNQKYGMGFIFNRRGKLSMISVTKFSEREIAYKVNTFMDKFSR